MRVDSHVTKSGIKWLAAKKTKKNCCGLKDKSFFSPSNCASVFFQPLFFKSMVEVFCESAGLDAWYGLITPRFDGKIFRWAETFEFQQLFPPFKDCCNK